MHSLSVRFGLFATITARRAEGKKGGEKSCEWYTGHRNHKVLGQTPYSLSGRVGHGTPAPAIWRTEKIWGYVFCTHHKALFSCPWSRPEWWRSRPGPPWFSHVQSTSWDATICTRTEWGPAQHWSLQHPVWINTQAVIATGCCVTTVPHPLHLWTVVFSFATAYPIGEELFKKEIMPILRLLSDTLGKLKFSSIFMFNELFWNEFWTTLEALIPASARGTNENQLATPIPLHCIKEAWSVYCQYAGRRIIVKILIPWLLAMIRQRDRER